MKNHDPIYVIGAGPAGIGAGLALGKNGIVLESSRDLGGICRTIELDGAIFDLGGHSFHTPHPQVRELVFGALDMYEQKREARCYSHGKLIQYPFQRHYRDLGNGEITRECDKGLAQADSGKSAEHFDQFIRQRFGEGIAQHFLLPYNRKLWGPNLQRMAADWVGERVAAAKSSSEKFDETGGKRKPLQPDTTVAYPARGGFGEIMLALARRLKNLRIGQKVVRIDPDLQKLYLEDGSAHSWRKIISTMPVDQLLALLPNVPESLNVQARRLEVLSLAVVLIVIDHPVDTAIQRIYCADPVIPAHKIAINHNSSPSLRALPQHGIMAEVSYCSDKPRPGDDLVNRTVDGLLSLGVIQSATEVRTTKVIDVRYGYPVPTHDRDAIVGLIKNWLNIRDIFTVGRFGEWAYINSDEAIHRGLELGIELTRD